MNRFLIADDHAIMRYAIRMILVTGYSGAYIEEVNNAKELLHKVATGKWDVVITDISMPGRSGLEILPEIKLVCPELPVLVVSMYSEKLYAVQAIKAGASGYLQKDTATYELVKAVKIVLQGKKYITPSVAEWLANSGGK